MAVIVLVVVLFSVDKSILLGFNYIGAIPLICIGLISIYIGKLEKKAEVNTKVKIIGMICFFATAIIGWLLIIWFPEIFNTYGL